MISLSRIDWRTRGWIVYLAVGAVLTAVYVGFPPLKGNGPLINLLGLSSSVAIAVGIRMHAPRARSAWYLFIVGQFLFFAGDLYTYSYPKLFGADVEFPSLGDAIYLMVYPALVAGLLVLVRHRNPGGDRAGVIDSLILTVGVGLLSWVFLVAPNIHLSGLTGPEKAVSVAYPLGDILLLAAAIRLAVDKGKRAPAFYLLIGSIVSLLAVDSAYTYALLTDAYDHQLSYDVGWIAYYLLWGAAALHPSMRTLEEPALESRTRLTPSATDVARERVPHRSRGSHLAGDRRRRPARPDLGVGCALPARGHPHGGPRAPGGARRQTRDRPAWCRSGARSCCR